MKGERERQSRKDNRGRILKKGEGQDKKTLRYYYSYRDRDGKRQKIYDNDLVGLREQEEDIKVKLANNIDISAGKRTLNEQFEIYLKTKDIKPNTRANYTNMWKSRVKDTIGKKRITDIKKSDLQVFYKSLKDDGFADGTIKLYANNLISPTLNLAVDDDIILKNPNKGCMKEYTEKPKEKEILTEEQQRSFLEFLKGSDRYDYYYPMFQFMFSTALRNGELIGMTWDNVDFENRVVYVKHQLVYKNYGDGCKFHAGTPKSDAGFRIIPMTQNCYKALKMQRENQFSMGIDRTRETDGLKGFVFCTHKGTPYMPCNLWKLIQRLCLKYNEYEKLQAEREKRQPLILPDMSSHTFRHTGCTRLAETHMDVKSLQEFMGHSDIKVTMNVYNHVNGNRLKKEIENAENKSDVI